MTRPVDNWKSDYFDKYGDRWRYVFLLEEEVKKRGVRRRFVVSSLALNAMLTIALILMYAGR